MEEVEPTLQAILKANNDFAQRVEAEHVDVDCDDEFDIFLITVGEPVPAATEMFEDGLQLRFDPATLKISGIEILGFRNRYLKKHPEFLEDYRALHPSTPSSYTPQEPAREAARKLIPA